MVSSSIGADKIRPAQLAFLTIFNPLLFESEVDEANQILFYYDAEREQKRAGGDAQDQEHAVQEQLRQIGLAQGILNFARSFSKASAVQSVETEKHRIVTKELESGWWILASVSLTRLPKSSLPNANAPVAASASEYSSREVSHPALLVEQILRAHRVFLLHHGPSLAKLYVRLRRAKFCAYLADYWTPVCRSWDVLLHGNPILDLYAGIKVAAGGELGIGVGEEEWGSGEREVLETTIKTTSGLVDLFCYRFGDEHPDEKSKDSKPKSAAHFTTSGTAKWLGRVEEPRPEDGLIFSGVGALTPTSLLGLSEWVRWIYMHGEHAYGIGEKPGTGRIQMRRARKSKVENDAARAAQNPTNKAKKVGREDPMRNMPPKPTEEDKTQHFPRIPPSIIRTESGPTIVKEAKARTEVEQTSPEQGEPNTASDTMLKYLTLGYGSLWGSAKQPDSAATNTTINVNSSEAGSAGRDGAADTAKRSAEQVQSEKLSRNNASSGGHFLIGLLGDLDEIEDIDSEEVTSLSDDRKEDWTARMTLRTLHIELRTNSKIVATKEGTDTESSSRTAQDSGSTSMWKRTRVLIYVNRPFIFVYLFDLDESSLSMPTFFKTLHHNLAPLHSSLLKSTSPSSASSRLRTVHPQLPASPQSFIYYIIYDPVTLMLQSSVQNIPTPGQSTSDTSSSSASSRHEKCAWTRIEALNTHAHILNFICETRTRRDEVERTSRTSKGWWIVWMRIPPPLNSLQPPLNPAKAGASSSLKEAILIRRASGRNATPSSGTASRYSEGYGSTATLRRWITRDPSSAAGSPTADPATVKLAEGIGIDARRYVDGLLSMNQ